MNTNKITPELEHDYIRYNSKLSIAVGILLSLVALESVIHLNDMNSVFQILFYMLIGITSVVMLYFLFDGNKFTKISLSKNAWTGTFDDEFLNSVNLSAYKYSFFAVFVIALVGMMIGRSYQLSANTMCSFIIATICITYGVTALYQLREQSE